MSERRIEFTQYLSPRGRKTLIWIMRPVEIADVADKLTDLGYRFEAEILITGHVSLTCVDPEDTGDIAHVMVPNGKDVPEAVDELVGKAMAFHEAVNA